MEMDKPLGYNEVNLVTTLKIMNVKRGTSEISSELKS